MTNKLKLQEFKKYIKKTPVKGASEMMTAKFHQGYLCAVSAIIQMHRGVDAQTKELFTSGVGKYDLKHMRELEIDEHDIEVFKKYRKELI